MSQLTLELIADSSSGYGTPQKYYLDLVDHVHKRSELFIYTDQVRDESVPIVYLENAELDSWRNIQLINRSYNIPLNSPSRIVSGAPWAKTTSVSYSTEYSDVLVTNRAFVDQYGKTRPLFLKHTLPADVTECSLHVVSGGERFDVDTGYELDLASSAIYTNYENFFNPDTGAYRLYYVVCTTSSGERAHELLNPVPVAQEATWEDIDLDTGKLITSRPIYSRERNTSGYTFYFNAGDTWYIKPLSRSLIQPRLPVGREPEDSWYLRFTAGDLSAYTNSTVNRYYLPEFDQQSFTPSKPYRFSIYERLVFVNNKTVAATRKNLKISPEDGLHIVILTYDVEGLLIRAFTTDGQLEGTRYSDTEVFYESDKILTWDNRSGIVGLGTKVHPSWTMRAQYYYEADDYEYSLRNLNPLQERDAKDYLFIFYCVPNVDADDRGIHHLVVDSDGVIIYSSQSNGFAYPNLQLKDSDGLYNPETVVGLKYISDIESDTFVTRYAVGYDNTNAYAILAEVVLNHLGWEEDQLEIDVRRKGGVVSSEAFSRAIRANPRILQSFLGYGEDGQEIPLTNVMYIRAPITLLEDYGGDLTQDQAEDLITQHLNSAVSPIIEWQYPASELSGDSTEAAQVDLTWTWEEPGLTYKLYRKTNPTGAWEEIHSVASPAYGGISYTDTDVVSGGVYYYLVRTNDGSYDYPGGNSLAVKVA